MCNYRQCCIWPCANINLLKSLRTTRHNIKRNSAWCPLCVQCFARISEHTAAFAVYVINWFVFITMVESVYSVVRTGSLNKAVCTTATTARSAHTVFMCFVFIWEQTATCATYSINWLGFITEMKSVYSAVRSGSLNKAVCASSLKG